MSGTQEKIRVLHVLGSLGIGGCERLCLDILRFHDRSKFVPQLAVFASPNGGLAPEFQSVPGLQIHKCLYLPPQRASFIVRFIRLCRTLRPDVVFCYAFGMHTLIGVSARMAGVKRAMVTVHNPSPQEGRIRRKTTWLAQLARPFFDSEVAVSQYVANDIQQAYRLPMKRVRVIHNGCDVESLHRRAERARQVRVPGDGLVIGMVGRLDTIKDQPTLIHAAAILRQTCPALQLKLIGDGPKRGELEQLVSELDLKEHVEFLGSRLDIPEQLGTFDVFAFATTSSEGFGIALIEALAAGVPVVATDVGPCREILESGKIGLLVPPSDAKALAGGIAQLLGDPVLSARLSRDGLRHARAHYDIRQTTRAYEALFTASE